MNKQAVIVIFLAVTFSSLAGANEESKGKVYLGKARQSEAKINLAVIYSSEKAFNAEYSTYTSDLEAMMITNDTKKPRYLCGFAKPFENKVPDVPGYDPKRIDYTFLKLPELTALKDLAKHFPKDAVVTATSFKAACVGNVDEDADLDIWTIDDKKAMVNVKSDI